MIDIREHDGAITFSVRVQPRASRDEISGEWEGALRVRLLAPALEDRANEALRRFLAQRLDVPLGAVRILAGERSRTKRMEIRGAAAAQVRALAASSTVHMPAKTETRAKM